MTAFAIKIIAISTMIIDHMGAVFDLDIGFRIVGRIAFPLFVYLIAEGCRHTKSMEKYMLRLGIFALVSEIPFDLAFNQMPNHPSPLIFDFLNNTNIFYTLFLGVACVYAAQKIIEAAKMFGWYTMALTMPVPIIAAMAAADWLSTDYGYGGVLFIFCMAMAGKHKWLKLLSMAVFSFWLYFPWGLSMDGAAIPILLYMFGASLLSVPIAALANGRRGRPVKWLFYLIYPGHLLLFAAIALIFT